MQQQVRQQQQEHVGRSGEEAGGPRQHDSKGNVWESDAIRNPDPLNGGLVEPVESSGGGGSSSSVQQQVVEAWEFGLSADGDAEWERRYGQLLRYRSVHGDAHCGFREGDDAALTRWEGGGEKGLG